MWLLSFKSSRPQDEIHSVPDATYAEYCTEKSIGHQLISPRICEWFFGDRGNINATRSRTG
jgi:hypothetical protein